MNEKKKLVQSEFYVKDLVKFVPLAISSLIPTSSSQFFKRQSALRVVYSTSSEMIKENLCHHFPDRLTRKVSQRWYYLQMLVDELTEFQNHMQCYLSVDSRPLPWDSCVSHWLGLVICICFCGLP
jgi:hypothetical protein